MRNPKKTKTPIAKLRKRLKKKAWETMRAFVLYRDKYTCVTCGKPGNHAGHYKHNALDFDVRNINCQCSGCNTFRNGKLDLYSIYLVQKYGCEVLEELEYKKNTEQKYTLEDYEAIINNIKRLHEWLREERNDNRRI